LPPGDSTVTFTTSEPPWTESVSSKRPLTFSIHNLDLTIVPADAATTPADLTIAPADAAITP
jgi:hypothetical protein